MVMRSLADRPAAGYPAAIAWEMPLTRPNSSCFRLHARIRYIGIQFVFEMNMFGNFYYAGSSFLV